MRARHGRVGCFIVKQAFGLCNDPVGIRAHQLGGSGRDALRPLGRLAHDENRLAERRSFFLHASTVGQNQGRNVEQADKVRVVEGLDQRDVVEAGQAFVHDLAHVGIGMDREYQRHVVAGREPVDGGSNRLHALAEILPPVAGHADDPLAGKARFQLGEAGDERRLALDPVNDPVQRIDDGVAGDVDRCRNDVLPPQRFGRGLGRGAVQCGDRANRLAVDLLRPRMVDVAAAQAGLDMAHRNPAVVGRERRAQRGRRVALDHDPIGPLLVHRSTDVRQQHRGEAVKPLTRLHEVEIVVWLDGGDRQHLVEQRAMLAAHADPAFEALVRRQRMHEREEFDCLGPGAENR